MATQTGHLIALVQDLVAEEYNFEHVFVTIQNQLMEARTVGGWEHVFLVEFATLKIAKVLFGDDFWFHRNYTRRTQI